MAAHRDLPLTDLAGWGRYPVIQGYEMRSENLERITEHATLSRGLGRSYGDASLPPAGGHVVAASPLADRLLAFDPATGLLRAEAGLSLARLWQAFLPRGWFPPATPGTQYVTLGGMVAADVHGKSHHREGCFGEHVTALRMRVGDGSLVEVTEGSEPDLLRATCGGMGLTGHILEVEFRMQRVASPWIWTETEQITDLGALVGRLAEASRGWPYTVAWVDWLADRSRRGRGLLQKGRWAESFEAPAAPPVPKRPMTVPIEMPDWFLQPALVRPLNAIHFRREGAHRAGRIVHPEAFFYPLDGLGGWNRLYGRRGFIEYQCVLPSGTTGPAFERFFATLDRLGGAPFLCVMKDFEREGKGMISFPKPGLAIALHMPVDRRDDRTQRLIDALNDIVAGEGGRIYLAKDAFTRPEHFRAMEPRLDAWTRVRERWDPRGTLRSAQAARLLGAGA
jgi:decaprenylphospho-beta-D-ribofuranose 2-oxidase